MFCNYTYIHLGRSEFVMHAHARPRGFLRGKFRTHSPASGEVTLVIINLSGLALRPSHFEILTRVTLESHLNFTNARIAYRVSVFPDRRSSKTIRYFVFYTHYYGGLTLLLCARALYCYVYTYYYV